MNVYPNESVFPFSLGCHLVRVPDRRFEACAPLRGASQRMCFVFHVEVWSEVVDIAILQIAHCRCAHVRWTCIPMSLFWTCMSLQLGLHLWCICFCAIPQMPRYDCVFPTDLVRLCSWKFHLWCICFCAIPQITRYDYVFPTDLLWLCSWDSSLVHMLLRYPSDYTLWLRVSNWSASSWQLEVSSLVYMRWRYPSDHTLWVCAPNWAASSLQSGFH